jgi:hypothetical protein
MTSGETEHANRIQEGLSRKFDGAIKVISTVRMESPGDEQMFESGRNWGLLFITAGESPQLVFYHFHQDSWVEALSRNRPVPRDRAVLMPAEAVRIIHADRPGFFGRLFGSDVGKIRIEVQRGLEREYENDRAIREDRLPGPVELILDLDSVGHAIKLLEEIIPPERLLRRSGSE